MDIICSNLPNDETPFYRHDLFHGQRTAMGYPIVGKSRGKQQTINDLSLVLSAHDDAVDIDKTD